MQDRRDFIRLMLGGAALAGLNAFPLEVLASRGLTRLTILHTNDVHSRIDPFPANDPKYPNMGGVARRSAIIRKIRDAEKNVLLLDAGDIFQGTPYFNMYGGKPELQLMSKMGYDAATIGNHDFDNGIEALTERIPDMNFPFLNVNYNFKDTPLQDKVLPYRIYRKGRIKAGVFGIGIELDGLVDKKLYGNTRYEDPILHSERISAILRNDYRCDLVICLSHLGYRYDEAKISDEVLARESSNIDLILGGHTHTFLDAPVSYKNKNGKEILVAQVGWAGIRLGRIDYWFDEKGRQKDVMTSTVKISENAIAS
jgi:5'-nucleotidase